MKGAADSAAQKEENPLGGPYLGTTAVVFQEKRGRREERGHENQHKFNGTR